MSLFFCHFSENGIDFMTLNHTHTAGDLLSKFWSSWLRLKKNP